MMDAAAAMGGLRYGTAQSGTTSSLVDERTAKESDYFTGGTLWILSGDNAGKCLAIDGYNEGTYAFEAQADPIAAGDEYAAADDLFKRDELRGAAMDALRKSKCMIKSEGEITTTDARVYTLPDGVSDVRRVQFMGDDGTITRIKNWQEKAGELTFYTQPESDKALTIWYAGRHPLISYTEHIKPGVSLEWLRWATVVSLYRNYIVTHRKDNPTALELFNEAKMIEAQHSMARMEASRLMPIEGIYKPWG